MQLSMVSTSGERIRCVICHALLDEPSWQCASCGTLAHPECKQSLRACPTLGCCSEKEWRPKRVRGLRSKGDPLGCRSLLRRKKWLWTGALMIFLLLSSAWWLALEDTPNARADDAAVEILQRIVDSQRLFREGDAIGHYAWLQDLIGEGLIDLPRSQIAAETLFLSYPKGEFDFVALGIPLSPGKMFLAADVCGNVIATRRFPRLAPPVDWKTGTVPELKWRIVNAGCDDTHEHFWEKPAPSVSYWADAPLCGHPPHT